MELVLSLFDFRPKLVEIFKGIKRPRGVNGVRVNELPREFN